MELLVDEGLLLIVEHRHCPSRDFRAPSPGLRFRFALDYLIDVGEEVVHADVGGVVRADRVDEVPKREAGIAEVGCRFFEV